MAIQKNNLTSLSEQQLVDCSTKNSGCSGGWPHLAFDYIAKHGIQAEETYEYTGKDGTCKYDKSKVVVSSLPQYFLYKSNPLGDEKELQRVLAEVGPVAVAFGAEEIMDYKSGIVECSHPVQTNHGVVLIGYGTESGQEYWLLKNSWGKDWGDTGYFKLARNAGNTCNIGTYFTGVKL